MGIVTPESVLFVRIDNIGDLVCTTPAIRAVRERYPMTRIGILVNSYNRDVVRGNPDIDEIYVYRKEKHVHNRGRLGVWLENLRTIREIRKERFHIAINCAYSYSSRTARYTFLTGARERIGYGGEGKINIFYTHPLCVSKTPVHEVLACMKLLEPLGIKGPPPHPFIKVDEGERKRVMEFLKKEGAEGDNIVAIHISSRKPENRWSVEKFRLLADRLGEEGVRVLILWSPGSRDNPCHPGDDEDVGTLLNEARIRPIAYRTDNLRSLIAAIDIARVVICLDGGAMHIASALRKPIVTIWGSTDRRRWAPWGTGHIILQKDTRRADSVTVDEVVEAFKRIQGG